ncbi:MAG: hypothetical protein R2848_06720 [Thermomicrobiales bacterium]
MEPADRQSGERVAGRLESLEIGTLPAPLDARASCVATEIERVNAGEAAMGVRDRDSLW